MAIWLLKPAESNFQLIITKSNGFSFPLQAGSSLCLEEDLTSISGKQATCHRVWDRNGGRTILLQQLDLSSHLQHLPSPLQRTLGLQCLFYNKRSINWKFIWKQNKKNVTCFLKNLGFLYFYWPKKNLFYDQMPLCSVYLFENIDLLPLQNIQLL